MPYSSEPGPSAEEARAPRFPRRWRWPLASVLIAAILVGLYAVLGFWVAPRVIKAEVVSQIAERYHRRAALGEVRLNPFTLTLEASGFRLPDADGKPMIGFDRLRVGVSAASLWRGLAFHEIELDGPRVRLVRRADGRLNIQDLVPPPPRNPPPNAKPLKLTIDRLTVRRGAAGWVDLALGAPFEKTFAPVDFKLDHFSTVKNGADYVLNAVTDRGERLAWRGRAGLSPIASRGRFVLTGVQLAPLWALAKGVAPFDLTRGALDVTGEYHVVLRREGLRLTVDVSDARASGLGLRARGADADWVNLPAVAVSRVHFDLAGRAVSAGRIEASDPSVDAWLDHGGLNLTRYAGPSRPEKPAPSVAAAGSPWTINLPDLRITGGKAAFQDKTAPAPMRMVATPIDLSVTGLVLPITRPVQVEASIGLEGGGRVGAKGTLALSPVSAELDVQARDLGLPRLQPYLDKSTGLKLKSGRLSGQGRLAYAANGAASFDGAMRIDDLHTVDDVLNQDFVNWRSLRLDGVGLRTRPLSVKIRQVTAQDPYARVVIGPTYVMNIATVLNPKAAASAAAAPPAPAASRDLAAPAAITSVSASPPAAVAQPSPAQPSPAQPSPAQPAPTPPARREALPIEIPLVRVLNGRMDFSDLSVQPHFSAGIVALNGTIKGLSGRQDARATVDLAGQVDRYAPVKIDGQVNYFAVRSFTDVKMDFQNMELTTFSPYSGKFAGYRINKGKLNVTLHYNIDDQKLHATHRVVINQLQLGEKVDSAEAVKLPVKLIVALLKDKNGVIDVPIEIDGTLNDPKFQIWPVIWKVVDNLLVKVASAPFTLLGELVGGGAELQYVDFSPGMASLDDAGRQKLATLAKALAERPAVNLEIPMPVDPTLDRPALVEARFKTELAAAAADQLGKRAARPGAVDAALAAPRTHRAILEALYRKTFAAKPDIPKPQPGANGAKPDVDQAAIAWLEDKLHARIAVTDQDLQQLGRARAEAAQAAVLDDGRINPSRVFVINAPPQDASAVRMTLSLS